jgi:hypothetical protein
MMPTSRLPCPRIWMKKSPCRFDAASKVRSFRLRYRPSCSSARQQSHRREMQAHNRFQHSARIGQAEPLAATARCLCQRAGDELVSPPDAPGQKVGVPDDWKWPWDSEVHPIVRKPRLSPMPGRHASESGNHWISVHDLSRRTDVVMPGRPAIEHRSARIGAVRLGLRNARAPQSAERKRCANRGGGGGSVDSHTELLIQRFGAARWQRRTIG